MLRRVSRFTCAQSKKCENKAWFPLGDKGDNCDTIVAYRTNRIVGTFSYRPYRVTIALIGLIALF